MTNQHIWRLTLLLNLIFGINLAFSLGIGLSFYMDIPALAWSGLALALCADVAAWRFCRRQMAALSQYMQQESEKEKRGLQQKNHLFASVSHELRTPLNAIIGYSELLAEELEESPALIDSQPNLKGDIMRILTAGKHLHNIIDTILDLSKIEYKMMELDLHSIDLREIFADVKILVDALIKQKNNVLQIDLPKGDLHIVNDSIKLKQILMNLLSNACKFTTNGTICLQLLYPDPADSDSVTIRVQDTGIGIPQAYVDKLFQAFQQVDTQTFRKYGGTGLGLALCKEYCRMMGGSISVHSIEGKGATFSVKVPKIVTSRLYASVEGT